VPIAWAWDGMDSTETRKLKSLLADLERLCTEAQEVRQKIDELTHRRPLWPERWEPAGPFSDPTRAHDLATPRPPDSNN
jgi:hypothetical protein